jgi:hypothetical protein
MQKYEVEESHVDFFAALKNLQSSVTELESSDEEVCLITNNQLDAFHIELACGHKFNYAPLYQEVLRQKGRFGMHNFYEKIGTHQVKCPYCRSMTNQLLPYIGNNLHPVIKRFVGINAPAAMCMPGTPCEANKCHANAFYECNQMVYCHKHYQAALKPKPVKPVKATNPTNPTNPTNRCIAENKTGKNKGTQCKITATPGTMLCRVHAKCNAAVVVVV